MKAITKKEFTKQCCNVIKELNDDELESVRRGLHILYAELKRKGLIEFGQLNSSSAFLLDIACIAAGETMDRIRKENNEVPY